MAKLFALLGASLFAISGCSSVQNFTQSRTVGEWHGHAVCSAGQVAGLTNNLKLSLKASSFPLISYGYAISNYSTSAGQVVSASSIQVEAESLMNNQALLTGKKVLESKGPFNIRPESWPATFVDDNTMKIEACGSVVTLKRSHVVG